MAAHIRDSPAKLNRHWLPAACRPRFILKNFRTLVPNAIKSGTDIIRDLSDNYELEFLTILTKDIPQIFANFILQNCESLTEIDHVLMYFFQIFIWKIMAEMQIWNNLRWSLKEAENISWNFFIVLVVFDEFKFIIFISNFLLTHYL